jgi:uncharacterized MAPEG superfamily protein
MRRSDLGSLLALLLFAVFAVCVLSVLLTGANAYRRLTERDQVSYDDRTVVQYLATKVRQADRAGGVTVETFQGTDALVLSEELDGSTYCTWLYCYNGYLRELFASADAELSPEDGEKILEAGGLQVESDGNTLRLKLQTDSGWRSMVLALRSGEGALS